MRCFLGLGSNLGRREDHLELAVQNLLRDSCFKLLRAAPLVETSAIVPSGAPPDWNLPFLNSVIEVDWSGSPNDLLDLLKYTEKKMGRAARPRWAPREIDLDILTFGVETFSDAALSIPHPEISKRSFVLTPLKYLAPNLILPGANSSTLELSRRAPLPLWMNIINLTPDSFSDGGQAVPSFEARLISAQILDLGAESTRPGATPIGPEEEWSRLRPCLEHLREQFRSRTFRPKISIDTRHRLTMERALEAGADIINDVSGLDDPQILPLLRHSGCQYILMHSLTVPANPHINLRSSLPIQEIFDWAQVKIENLKSAGVPLNRVIFDPGIGFNKTAEQSFQILKNIKSFYGLGVRILVGHSRKSFLKRWGEIQDRDLESIGVSIHLADQGVDILRVHQSKNHERVLKTYQDLKC